MKNRITLLVDGNYLLKRSYSVKSNYYTEEFGNIDAIFNFFLTLRKISKQYNINKIMLFWDGENGGKLRYNIYEGYKANREHKEWYNKISMSDKDIKREEEKDKSLLKQKIRIQQYVEELFIRQIPGIDLIEADDLIAQYCLSYHNSEYIIIYTNDRDMCQLVDLDNVNVYLANKNTLINRNNFKHTFDFHYKNARLVKTLCGDNSDNIRGVSRFKETSLFKYFPEVMEREVSIDEILEKSNNKLTEYENHKELNKGNKKVKPLYTNTEYNIYYNIVNGIDMDGNELGRDLYDINFKLVNLFEPQLTKEARHILKEMSETPIDDTNRGSKNLISMMYEDGFLKVWNGSVNTFCLPFFPTIIKEKNFLKNS